MKCFLKILATNVSWSNYYRNIMNAGKVTGGGGIPKKEPVKQNKSTENPQSNKHT